MPTYLTPGVYVEEIPAQSKPIEGVGTAIAAFVGLAPGGPINKAVKISNWSQFVRIFGDKINRDNGPWMEGAYLPHAVYGYFHNGGGVCYVTRVGRREEAVEQAALPLVSDVDREAYRALAREGVDGPIKVVLEEDDAAPAKPAKNGKDDGGAKSTNGAADEKTYRLVVLAGDDLAERESHGGLTLGSGKSNIATQVNAQSKLITIEEVATALPEAERAPATGSYELEIVAGDGAALSGTGVEGDTANRTGIGGLAAVDEITMLCVPDLGLLQDNGDTTMLCDLQRKMIAHCEGTRDRMAILDAPKGLSPQQVGEWRMKVGDFAATGAGHDSKFAALYYPWIKVSDPLSGGKKQILVPPCGHVAGIWARSDSTRGVHKAPANEVLLAVNDLEFQVTGGEQEDLNRNGVNCIRAFAGRGIRIWGARTLSSDPEWRYINVRRLFNYVSESIMQGTQWAVFEPNDQRLWMRLKISATNFLTRTWREGALFGATPAQAFYVKCDEETNPPDLVEAGQVTVEIGIAPVKPAEFVVFRISQYQAGDAA